MTDPTAKRPWEQRLHDAAATVEEELRRVVTYINDEVVPEVRQNSSKALYATAAELERLARKMDERSGTSPPRASTGTPPPPAGTTGS